MLTGGVPYFKDREQNAHLFRQEQQRVEATKGQHTMQPQPPPLMDQFGRQVKDLRISVTDRCNYRCFYCKPAESFGHIYRSGLLSYEELVRASRLFVEKLGVEKIRLTGGEPLLRKEIDILVEELASIPGLQDLAMTTNAYLLPAKAQRLRDAGLQRLTISLDSLRPDRFAEITRHDSLDRVFKGIQAAEDAGFGPLKINAVVIRGVNDDEILDFAKFSRETGHIVRFIEFMPLDEDRKWDMTRVVPQAEIVQTLEKLGPLENIGRSYSSETANKFRYADGKGEIGIIASVTSAFCGQCSRIRLTADGKIRTCLFSLDEDNLLERMRRGDTDEQLLDYIREVTWRKQAGHRITAADYEYPERSMSLIGG